MSSVYFHSPSAEVEICGSERAYCGWLCNRILLSVLDLRRDCPSRPHPLRYAFPSDHYTARRDEQEWVTCMENAISVGSEVLMIGERRSSFATAALNTALAIGSDQLKLAARLHGQCEIHTFVEGPNRAWLAAIIEDGRRLNIFRARMGWEDVVELLRSSSDEPVVTSYSVCEQFPNRAVAIAAEAWSTLEAEDDVADTWYNLPEEEQWRLAMDGLRLQSQQGYNIELKPDNWQNFSFGQGVTAFDIMRHFESVAVARPR